MTQSLEPAMSVSEMPCNGYPIWNFIVRDT